MLNTAELSPKREGTALRFSMSQALLLDALLQEEEIVTWFELESKRRSSRLRIARF